MHTKAKYDLTGKDKFTDSEITASTSVLAAESPSNSYLQISSQRNLYRNSSVGEAIHFKVEITEKLAKITYKVLYKSDNDFTCVFSGNCTGCCRADQRFANQFKHGSHFNSHH